METQTISDNLIVKVKKNSLLDLALRNNSFIRINFENTLKISLSAKLIQTKSGIYKIKYVPNIGRREFYFANEKDWIEKVERYIHRKESEKLLKFEFKLDDRNNTKEFQTRISEKCSQFSSIDRAVSCLFSSDGKRLAIFGYKNATISFKVKIVIPMLKQQEISNIKLIFNI